MQSALPHPMSLTCQRNEIGQQISVWCIIESRWISYISYMYATGMMDWDDTSIVFTKRSLIQFLKYAFSTLALASLANLFWRYTGTTVDTNFQNISKLPSLSFCALISLWGTDNYLYYARISEYATFGKISGGGSNEPTAGEDVTCEWYHRTWWKYIHLAS